MWNRSSPKQKTVRIVAGGITLSLAVLCVAVGGRSTPARRAQSGALDLMHQLDRRSEVQIEVTVPQSLGTTEGTLVYLHRADGTAQVVGRVMAVRHEGRADDRLRIRLVSQEGGVAGSGGVLNGAPAALDLRDAVRLLISPDTLEDEARRARDAIWPSISDHVMPQAVEGLIAEVSKKLRSLDTADEALLAKSMSQLQQELQPLEEELINRLATRTWEIVGARGLAAGIWRSTADDLQNKSRTVTGLWWQFWGDDEKGEPADRPFFSEETSRELQQGLAEETVAFWRTHRDTIFEAVARVARERRPEFEASFRERWAGDLYNNAIVPAWQGGQEQVLVAAQDYANDFAARRLLTKGGGPRLLFAHALRSALNISEDPLLVFTPSATATPGQVTFELLLR